MKTAIKVIGAFLTSFGGTKLDPRELTIPNANHDEWKVMTPSGHQQDKC